MKVDNKNRFRVTLTDDALDYIEELKKEQNITYNGDVIAFLIKDYQRLKKEQWSLNYITESVMKTLTNSINENLKEELKRIRLGTNNTDRNTQIMLELFNGLMFANGIEDIVTTNDLKTKPYQTAEDTVQEKIEIKRQKRLEWESNRQKGVE